MIIMVTGIGKIVTGNIEIRFLSFFFKYQLNNIILIVFIIFKHHDWPDKDRDEGSWHHRQVHSGSGSSSRGRPHGIFY